MKIILSLLCCLAILGCSKKTQVIDSTSSKYHSKALVDTSVNRTSATIDKTITITSRLLDSNITVTGKPLTGYLFIGMDTTAYFENEDMNLFLRANKGIVTAIATPKPKTITVKLFEKKAVYNDIVKAQQEKNKGKTFLEAQVTANTKHSEKEITPNNKVAYGLVALILLIALALIIVRKMGFTGKLLSW